MMESAPKFVNGVFAFEGKGYDKPVPVNGGLAYVVPFDKRAQLIYLRAGNSSSELIYLTLMRDGKPMRYFPIGAKASEHVSLAVTEDIFPESRIELLLGAPAGAGGTVVLDMGVMEI